MMKNKKIILALITGLFLIVGCRNEETPIIPIEDYRDKWQGAYLCEEGYSWWLRHGGSGEGIYQTKTIVSMTAIGDSTLKLFENRTEKSYEAKVNADGSFVKYREDHNHYGLKGSFIGDSINMTITPPHGLGFGSVSYYKGKKIK